MNETAPKLSVIEQLPFDSLDAIPIPIILSESISSEEGSELVHRYVNKAFLDQIGYNIEEMPDTKTWFDLAYPNIEYRHEIIKSWNKQIKISESEGNNLVQMSALIRCKNGKSRWFNVVANLHTANLHFVTFIDIHELKSTLEENERLSLIDPMTGLDNRRKALGFLTHKLNIYKRTNTPYSIVFCDIDLFKNINDTYGHQCGDEIIRNVSKTLLKASREIDCVARWGGEEFLIVLPVTDKDAALTFAERLRIKIEKCVLFIKVKISK